LVASTRQCGPAPGSRCTDGSAPGNETPSGLCRKIGSLAMVSACNFDYRHLLDEASRYALCSDWFGGA